MEGGGSFYIFLSKTSCWELASKNRNIRNLNISRYRQNRAIRFSKSDCPIFPGSMRYEVYEAIVFHSSHMGFKAMLSIETLLAANYI
jgi:hypothetical protein